MDLLSRLALLRRTALVLCCLPSTAVAQTRSEIESGRELAERLCAGCHVTIANQSGMYQGTRVPTFAEIANLPNRTQGRLEAFVTTPRHPMPAIPLQSHDVRNLVIYIKSLQ
jgi:porphobilinogen deaminase